MADTTNWVERDTLTAWAGEPGSCAFRMVLRGFWEEWAKLIPEYLITDPDYPHAVDVDPTQDSGAPIGIHPECVRMVNARLRSFWHLNRDACMATVCQDTDRLGEVGANYLLSCDGLGLGFSGLGLGEVCDARTEAADWLVTVCDVDGEFGWYTGVDRRVRCVG